MPKRNNFNDPERDEVIRFLLAGSNNGVLRRGSYEVAAEKFECYWRTIKRLWKKYEQQLAAGVDNRHFSTGRGGNLRSEGHSHRRTS